VQAAEIWRYDGATIPRVSDGDLMDTFLLASKLQIPLRESQKEDTRMTKQHFGKTYGGNTPENYERFFVPVIGAPLATELIRLAALRPGERVLDVGCGTGVVARLAARQVGATGTVAGLDVNPGMLAVARSITSPGTSIEWYEASAESMPLSAEAFDVVLCQLSLQFMSDKLAALQEMRRVLVHGGRMLLSVSGPAGRLFAVLAEAMERHISPEAAGFVRQVFSLNDTSELQRLTSDAGFRDVAVQANAEMLHLPPPKEFLWQYVHSTPLAEVVAKADEEERAALERDVVAEWQDFEEDGAMTYQQRIVVVTARK
jgi:ubiquinone/menaquinone biosynthesis C-methylase UbiE